MDTSYTSTDQKIGRHNMEEGFYNLSTKLNNNIIFLKTINGGTGKYIVEFSFIFTSLAHSISFGSSGLIDHAKIKAGIFHNHQILQLKTFVLIDGTAVLAF